jgi:hypothetical protein
MTACPAPERIAASAAGHDDAVLDHVVACARCERTFADQRAVALALGALAPPAFHASRRAALANAVHVAARDLAVARDRRWLVGAGALAAAAAIVLVVITRSPILRDEASVPHATVSNVVAASVASSSIASSSIASSSVASSSVASSSVASSSVASSSVASSSVASASVATPSVAAPSGGSRGASSTGAHVRHHAAASAHTAVFGGSAQIAGERVAAGEPWQPTASGFDWFRRGWAALRDGRDDEALAAFDRADAPAIASDAAFWAAVAAERAGHDDARARFERFVARFPDSEHVGAARAHLARL